MNRRGFLKLLGPIAATVAVPELARTIILPPRGGWPVKGNPYFTSNTTWFLKTEPSGFGLAPVKREGALVAYDRFAEILRPGMEQYFAEQYDRYELDWRKEFESNDFSNNPKPVDLSQKGLEDFVQDLIDGKPQPTAATTNPSPELTEANLEDMMRQIKQEADARGIKVALDPKKSPWYVIRKPLV